MTLISVIVPVFNRGTEIKSTINSVLKQKFRDFELIVVDDGSTDDLKNILSSEILSKELLYVYQDNHGVSSARNTGSFHAIGEYLVFLDSDDIVSENWLFDYYNVIEQKKPDIIYCGINRIQGNNLVAYTDPRNPYGNKIDYGTVIPGSFCIKSNYFIKIGRYDPLLAYGENTELGFRIKMGNPTFSYISAANLNYIMHENSHGKNSYNKMNGIVYTLSKHQQMFSSNTQLRKRYLSIAGVAAVKCKEYKKAKILFFEALKIWPLEIQIIFRYFIVYIPFLRERIWK